MLLSHLKTFSHQRLAWALLLCAVLFFEVCALFFQHVLLLSPCVMCIYERVAMLGIVFSAAIGLIAPANPIFRWIGLAGWGISAYHGTMLAIQHVGYQFNPSPFSTCDLFVRFPTWAQLDQWFPWMFKASGECSKIVWQFMTLSMPQWLVIIFIGNLVAFAFIVVSQFVSSKGESLCE